MTRKFSLTAFAATQCLIIGLAATAPARAADIPQYFFSQWTVTANCTEASAGPAGRVQPGLQFKIGSQPAADGTYSLQAINAAGQQWHRAWSNVKLEYRAGTPMATVPADFTCVPGAETASASSSPFLAMSGYVQTAEPYYAQEHWYGLVKVHGQLEHVLIFPRAASGDNSAIVVLQSASAAANISLDDNGVISSRN
ncbi:MAG TPA: hypothetical protein VGC34_12005 [Steroidobacteraceae bacterium]